MSLESMTRGWWILRWDASANHRRMETTEKTKHADATSTETGLSYSVRIEATFGSHFQRSVAIKNLNAALATWKGARRGEAQEECGHNCSEQGLEHSGRCLGE